MATLCKSLFAGRCEDYTPRARDQLFSANLRRLGTLGADEFLRQLLEHWRCRTPEDLAKALGCKISVAIISRTLEGAEYAATPYLLFAMCQFASTLTTGSEVHDDTQDMFLSDAPSLLSQEAWEALQAHAVSMGFPLAAARKLAEGVSCGQLQVQRQATFLFSRAFVDSAPEWVRDRLPQAKATRKKRVWPRHLARPDPQVEPTEAMRTLHRGRLMHLMEEGARTRTALTAESAQSMKWIRENDKDWLETFCPCKTTYAARRNLHLAGGDREETSAGLAGLEFCPADP